MADWAVASFLSFGLPISSTAEVKAGSRVWVLLNRDLKTPPSNGQAFTCDQPVSLLEAPEVHTLSVYTILPLTSLE